MKYLLIAGLACSLFACKNDKNPVQKNNEVPVLELLSPKYNNMMYSYQDTMRIKANLSDDGLIAQVSVSLIRIGSSSTEMKFQKTVNKATYLLDTFYVFQNASMADYVLQIIALDNHNSQQVVERQLMQH